MIKPEEITTGMLPVFPLSDAVLFPHTVLPLHVFEPRYREMVRDASSGDGRIAIALLAPGYESGYHGNPPFHPVATVGRIEDLQPLADGRFLLDLVGEQRVELTELPSGRSYRIANVRLRPEHQVDEDSRRVKQAKIELLSSNAYLLREISSEAARPIVLNEQVSFAQALNGICANLPVDAEVRQRLLERDDLLDRHRQASRVIDRVLRKVLNLKDLNEGDPQEFGPQQLN